MYLNLEKLKIDHVMTCSEQVDYSNREISEVLLKKINYANIFVDAYYVEPGDVHVSIEVEYNIQYLDAYTLDELNLTYDFSESIIFTSDLQRAEELDLDYIDSEIDINELVFQLILVDVPLNYSENKDSSIKLESEINLDDTLPFADLFK